MPSIFNIIGQSFAFYRKQPVLNQVVFWLLFLPPSIVDLSASFIDSSVKTSMELEEFQAMTGMEMIIALLVGIALIYFFFWGLGSTLAIGQRIIKSPAGRNRSSFTAVRKQGRQMILPLFYTEIIRSCLILLWFLIPVVIGVVLYEFILRDMEALSTAHLGVFVLCFILALPGILYAIRTVFYDIIIASENVQGRDALKKSREYVQTAGTGKIFLYFCGIGILLLMPPGIIENSVRSASDINGALITGVLTVLSNAINSFFYMLFILSSITLFKALKSS